MKSYNVILQVELVTQVCCPDRLITQPTYFLLSTCHRLHLTACVHNVLMLECLRVVYVIQYFSSSIKICLIKQCNSVWYSKDRL